MKFTTYILLLVTCSSCTSLYIPNVRNVPMFTRKGEFHGTLSAGTGYNLQTAYAAGKHMAVASSVLYANNRESGTDHFRIHKAFDFAVGYYLGRKWTFDVFAGYGRGEGHGRHMTPGIFSPSVPYVAEGAYQKLFLQSTVGIKLRMIEFAFTPRISRVDFHTADITLDQKPATVMLVPVYFIEPCLTVKFFPNGQDGIYVFKQVGYNQSVTADEKVFFDYESLHWNIGIGVRINTRSDVRHSFP